MATKYIRVSTFAFDDNDKMIGRMGAVVHRDEFDLDWITEPEMISSFKENMKVGEPLPVRCLALIENVESIETVEPSAA